jgi:hypothetical protein
VVDFVEQRRHAAQPTIYQLQGGVFDAGFISSRKYFASLSRVTFGCSSQKQRHFPPAKKAATMGIPYSKQINLAFDHVTPLVAAGFKVLQTTRNVTYLLAAVQVLTAVFLGLILITLLALIITVSPDLEHERQALVTPTVRWLAVSVMQYGGWVKVGVGTVITGCCLGAAGGWYVTREVAESVDVEVEDPEGKTKAEDNAGS